MTTPISPLARAARWWILVPAVVIAPARGQPSTTLAGQVEVVRLVDLAAERLNIAIDYDAAAVKSAGTVSLRAGDDLSNQELWLLMNRVLAARGLTTVRAPGTSAFSVVKLADAAGLARTEPPAQDGPLPGFRTVVTRLKHRAPKDVIDAVNKVIAKPSSGSGGAAGGAAALGDGGLIVISDLSTHIDQALDLLERLDVPGPATVVEEVKVHNIPAAALATLIVQVSAKRELVAQEKIPGEALPGPDAGTVLVVAPAERLPYWKDLIATLDQRERTETAAYTPKTFPVRDVGKLLEQSFKAATDDRWKLVVDDLTGSLIVTATPAQHEQIKAMIERLDSAPASVRRPVRSFVIRNRPVRDIQAILEQLVQSGVLAADATSSGTPTAPAVVAGTAVWPPQSPAQASAASPSPAASPQSPQPTPFLPRPSGANLPGSAPKNASPELSLSSDEGTNTLIAMGEPRLLSQVESLLQTLDVRQPQVMLEVLIVSLSDSQTMDLGIELEKLTGGDTRTRISSLFGLATRDAAGNVTAGSGLGLTGVVLDPGDFSVVLRALQTLNKGRSLSMPRLLVTNNQQATLDSILEQPYASTNASNTVTTTSFGGTKPAGTQLTLKPQIAGGGEGDHLLLDYSVSLSAFVGAAANSSLPPPRQENKLQSIASLPDGHTVVVGGIELTTDGNATNQVPGLGSIPVLGEIFKSRSRNASRSRFYVFIRANILRARGFEDLKYISQTTAEGAGVDDGWPVVEPLVIR